MKIYSLLLISILIYSSELSGQSTDSLQKYAPSIYLDCNRCDHNYIKKEITFVNYVRDRLEADVHIMVTRQETGSGGTEWTQVFLGQNRFSDCRDTLIYNSNPDNTDDEIRQGLVESLKLGLVRYVARTPLGKSISISFEKSGEENRVEDKWKHWVYRLGVNGWLNGQETYRSLNSWGSISATKVTPELRIEIEVDASYNEDRYALDDTTTLLSIRRSQYFSTDLVFSINDHWSWGGTLNLSSSKYSNNKFRYALKPAIEYNLFKYSESTHHQLRFIYSLGYGHAYYNDTTIYDKIDESFYKQVLGIALEVKRKWGSINSSVEGSNLINDMDKLRITFWSNLRLRVFKGFSVNFGGNFQLIRDQISLPKGGASSEDILLRQREIATNYSYWGNFGLSYTFGSIYNNVVNPRFGN